MIRHLRALPTLLGRWSVWPTEGTPRWMMPADDEAAAMGIPYLALRSGRFGRLRVVSTR